MDGKAVAEIQFPKPGRTPVKDEFTLSPARTEFIRLSAPSARKHFEPFSVQVRDEQGEVVTQVERTLYVCRMPNRLPSRNAITQQQEQAHESSMVQ